MANHATKWTEALEEQAAKTVRIVRPTIVEFIMPSLRNDFHHYHSLSILARFVNARVVICKSEQLLNLAYFELITVLNPHTGGSFSGFGKILVYQ